MSSSKSAPPALAVSVAEAAAMLGVSRGTLYPLLMAGVIPSATIKSRRVVSVAALSRWLDERTADASTREPYR